MRANTVPVKVALPAYHHTHELVSGAIELVGMSPTFLDGPDETADIADLPLAEYVSRRQSGDTEFTAVPAFPARAFVHAWIHVPADGAGSSTEAAEETAFSSTAAVYARGLLKDRGESVERIIVAPAGAVGQTAAVHPLFERPGEAERADYQRTGVYPILSVIAIRTELMERERWLASNVFRAFEVTRRRYFARLQDIRGSRAPIPSVAGHVRALQEVFGPDLWPYGLEANRTTLEAFVRYASDQGLIADAPDDVAYLFANVEPFVDFTDGH